MVMRVPGKDENSEDGKTKTLLTGATPVARHWYKSRDSFENQRVFAFNRFKHLDAWTLQEAACLLSGLEPGQGELHSETAIEELKRAVVAEKLKPIAANKKGDLLLNPYDVAKWWDTKRDFYPEFPYTLADLEPVAEASPVTEETKELETLEKPAMEPVKKQPRVTDESLLKVFIAFCHHKKLDLNERGLAGKIARLADQAEVAVSDDTVSRIIAAAKKLLEELKK